MKAIRLLAILEATTITGPAKNLLQFAQTARGHDQPVELVVATFRRDGESDLFLRAAEQSGVAVYPIVERNPFDPSVTERLAALVKSVAPDIVQTHAVKSHFLARRAGLDQAYPWVAFHHGYTWPALRVHAYNQLDRWSLRTARRVITVSRAFADELAKKGVPRERIAVVHNAVDPEAGAPEPTSSAGLRSQLGIASESKVILTVGRLSREKDHRTLLRSIGRIQRQEQVKPHLVIVGDGPEGEAIRQEIHALRLSSCVTMTGQVSSAAAYYAIADLAVVSSRSEGSPNALLEAMAARVPVVATAVGGIPEIVSHRESALLILPGDANAMADAITALLTDRELAKQVIGRAHDIVETRHNPAARARALTAIYRSLLD